MVILPETLFLKITFLINYLNNSMLALNLINDYIKKMNNC
jgi:hypothetical protein